MKNSQHNAFIRYGTSILILLLALVIQYSLINSFSIQSPFLVFLAAIGIIAYFLGSGPGIVVTLLSAVIGYYFFLHSSGEFSMIFAELLQTLLFIFVGFLISYLSGLFRAEIEKSELLVEDLRRRSHQHEAIAEIGEKALSGMELRQIFNGTAEYLATTLEVEYTKVLQLLPDGKQLILRAGYGWNKDVVDNKTTLSAGKNSQAGYTLLSKRPVIVKNLRTEKRFVVPKLHINHHIVSGISCIIQGDQKPWGVLNAHSIYRKEFTRYDVRFLQSVANLLALVIQRKALEQRKDEFIEAASHELKTPLTSIKALTQILEKHFQEIKDTKAIQFIAKMDNQVNKLTALIYNLLDIAKIQSGQLELHQETLNITDVVKTIAEDIQLSSHQHSIVVEGIIERPVRIDRYRIEQVIENLLSNAIKYSPEADKIYVKLSDMKGSASIRVQDFGIGVPKSKQEKIFERFYRIAGKKRESFPGLGLGLYISNEIIKKHGGTLAVESTEDKGSTFEISLPYSKI